jgi:hypothetical protein
MCVYCKSYQHLSVLIGTFNDKSTMYSYEVNIMTKASGGAATSFLDLYEMRNPSERSRSPPPTDNKYQKVESIFLS